MCDFAVSIYACMSAMYGMCDIAQYMCVTLLLSIYACMSARYGMCANMLYNKSLPLVDVSDLRHSVCVLLSQEDF